MVKNPPTNAGDVGSIPGREDPLEKKMATQSSILAWRIPWTEEPGRLQFMESAESDSTEGRSTRTLANLRFCFYGQRNHLSASCFEQLFIVCLLSPLVGREQGRRRPR